MSAEVEECIYAAHNFWERPNIGKLNRDRESIGRGCDFDQAMFAV